MKRSILLLACFAGAGLMSAHAQCAFRTTAIASGDTLHCVGGDNYRTAVAYNPVHNLYYSVDAGGTTPDETFDASGNQVYSSIVGDWRGLWWNPNTQVMEGNIWGEYFLVDSLQANGYLGGTTTMPALVTPPNVQAPGVYDAAANMIYYYSGGTLYGESRADFTDITPITMSGVPSFSQMLDPTLIFTGCPGSEIGLFDAGTNTLYLFNKSTGARTASVAFPSTMLPPSYSMGNFSYANEIVWLYNGPSNIWVGYDIYSGPMSVDEVQTIQMELYPNPAQDLLQLRVSEPTEVNLMNLLGEVLHVEQVQGEMTLDVSGLPAGIYLLRAADGTTTKFVKE